MKKLVYRLVFGSSLVLVAGLAAAQHGGGSSHSGGSSGGGSHSYGGGGFSGSHGFGGGYSGSRSSGSSGGYTSHWGSGYGSGSASRSGGTSTHYSGMSNYSRYQSNSSSSGRYGASAQSSAGSRYSGSGSQGRFEGGSASGSRYSGGGENGSRYSGRSTGENSSFTQSHADESRSGSVNYKGNNNLNTGSLAAGSEARVGMAPRGLIGPGGGLGKVIGNGGGGRGGFGGGYGGFRHGYYGYGAGWRDGFFAFPFYVFDPFLFACYASPWYYYPCLPAYVGAPNVIIESAPQGNWSGNDYDWAPESRSSSNPVLDDSIEDLVQSFENDDHKAIDRVTPHSGNVKIFVDGKYSYSLKANDFYDTYVDGIESTKTDRYEILSSQVNADGTARVVAKHVYNDPWGNRTYVYHTYFMVKEGDEYVIREFGTSNYRAGW